MVRIIGSTLVSELSVGDTFMTSSGLATVTAHAPKEGAVKLDFVLPNGETASVVFNALTRLPTNRHPAYYLND